MSNAMLDDGIEYVGEDLHEISSFSGDFTMRKALGEKLHGSPLVGIQAVRYFPAPGRERSENI